MPVNLAAPDPKKLFAVPGVALGVAEANIRKPDRKDLLLVTLEDGAAVAGIYTQNRFCAAPVTVTREHVSQAAPGAPIRALVVNTGCANAGTGTAGVEAARATCSAVAELLHCRASQVLPFSTGVIMERLPLERIAAGLPQCIASLRPDNWAVAAEAIMTTDTVPKAASRRCRIGDTEITVTGIAKGAGMIHPNMATMLAFVATDACVPQRLLQQALRHAAHRSFNCITVDGDTSTNDSFMLIATGRAHMAKIDTEDSAAYRVFRDAVTAVAIELAQAIVRDGEGATKFITVRVEGGRDEAECRRVAYAIAHSPLVKTAFFASDPNLGRILAAVGNAGIEDLDVANVQVYLDDVLVASNGGRDPHYEEAAAQRVMRQSEFTVRVVVNRGAAAAVVWTCDLSHGYVSINADYRS